MKELYKKVFLSKVNVEKTRARVSARQYFACTLSAIFLDLRTGLPESMGRSATGNACSSVKKCAHISKTLHISFATARVRVSAKEQQEPHDVLALVPRQ